MMGTPVLIESDWNLKYVKAVTYETDYDVLIESDWNLKDKGHRGNDLTAGINRIRLEFKDYLII